MVSAFKFKAVEHARKLIGLRFQVAVGQRFAADPGGDPIGEMRCPVAQVGGHVCSDGLKGKGKAARVFI